jgi:hypothetical protein
MNGLCKLLKPQKKANSSSRALISMRELLGMNRPGFSRHSAAG